MQGVLAMLMGTLEVQVSRHGLDGAQGSVESASHEVLKQEVKPHIDCTKHW